MEYAARHPQKFGGVVGLSGGLIGSKIDRDNYTGNLQDTAVLIGVGANDQYLPMDRIHQSAKIMEQLGGSVTKKIYPDTGHTIVEEEVKFVRGILANIVHT